MSMFRRLLKLLFSETTVTIDPGETSRTTRIGFPELKVIRKAEILITPIVAKSILTFLCFRTIKVNTYHTIFIQFTAICGRTFIFNWITDDPGHLEEDLINEALSLGLSKMTKKLKERK